MGEVNPGVFRHVYGAVQHILIKVGSEAKSDIVSQLCEDIEESELATARNDIFIIAKDSFMQRNSSDVEVEIDMKARKGKNALTAISNDIHDLYSYIVFPDSVFPKEVIRQSSRLLEFESNKENPNTVDASQSTKNDTEISNDIRVVTLSNEVCDLKAHVKELKSKLSLNEQAQKSLTETVNNLLSQLVVCGVIDVQNKVDRSDNVCNISNVAANVILQKSAMRSNNDQLGVNSTPVLGTDQLPIHTTVTPANAQSRDPPSANQTATVTLQRPRDPAVPGTQLTGAGNSNDSRQNIPDPANRSFSEAARSEGPWNYVHNRRDYKNTRQDSDKSGLRGVKSQKPIYVYLRNVYVENDDSEHDLKSKVREHALARNVRIMNIHIKYNRFTDDVVGCKLAVPAQCIETVLQDNFWPEEIDCKKWVDRSRVNNPRFNRRDNPRSSGENNHDHNRDGEYERFE